MTRIAFVQNLAYEYLGVMYLSASLKQAGHEVQAFIRERSEEALAREVLEFAPDLVAFSCTTGIHHWALHFAGLLKRYRPVPTIFGGPHATFFPELIEQPSVDVICRGEGEEAIVEIADRLDSGKPIDGTLNCHIKRNGQIVRNDLRPLIGDLDCLPNPDRSVYRAKYPYLDKTQAAFMAGRGCPFRCSFCFNHALRKLYEGRGRFVRVRKPERVVDEIVEAKSRWNLRTIYMQDDTFILDKRWVQEFSELYRERVGLPMLCLVRADQADEASIAALKRAGVKNIFFGIESGDETLRNELLKKGVTDQDIYRTAALLRKHGIRFRTYNMVGLPGETLQQALKTLRINAEIRTDFPWCAIFHPFPGTELGEFAARSDLLMRSPEDAPPSFFKESIIRLPQANEVVNLQKLFYYGVRFPRLIPLIDRIIRLRPNPIFEFLFLTGYAVSLYGSENLTLGEIASIGLRNVRQFFYGKSQRNTG
ncbi:MAG: B12-binding domain-containing radical SAM protein [Candidatus Hydrogenedentota bacterium]|nr:MAG: B12-binding domain-containing radical SAM protein [Candidatus Hydrogenedentota bacterium]